MDKSYSGLCILGTYEYFSIFFKPKINLWWLLIASEQYSQFKRSVKLLNFIPFPYESWRSATVAKTMPIIDHLGRRIAIPDVLIFKISSPTLAPPYTVPFTFSFYGKANDWSKIQLNFMLHRSNWIKAPA